MTQTIEYVVKVNAADAQKAVADVEKRFGGVDSVVARVDKNMIMLEKDIKDLNAAIAAGGPNVERYTKELEALSRAAGHAVGAAPGGAAAGGGGKNMGYGLLMFSQTLDDAQYGIKGVVNNVPGLVQGLGLGMGVAGVAQIAMIAVAQLTGAVTDFIKKQQEASQAAIKIRNSILDMRIASLQTTEDLRKKLDELNTEISGGKSAVSKAQTEKEIKDLESSISNNEQRLEQLKNSVLARFPEGTRLAVFGDAERLMSDAEKREATAIKLRINADKEGIENSKTQLDLKLKILAAEEKLAGMGKGSGGRGGKPKTPAEARDYAVPYEEQAMYGTGFSGLTLMSSILESTAKMRAQAAQDAADLEKEIRNEIAKHEEKARREAERAEQLHQSRLESLQGEGLAARMAFDDIATEHSMENLDRLKAHEFKNLKDRVDWQKNFYDDIGNLLKDSTSSAIGLTEEYLAMRIEGAENAEAIVAQKFLAGVGQQLVGVGTKYLFEGAGMSILGDPRGPLILGLGAGAIATGVAMGAGSAAWAHTMNGGQIGKPLEDDKAKRDRGTSPRRGRDSGGSGGLNVYVTYGAGGPLPEDIAREIDKVVKQNDRRRGAA
jgi:hypothetical protein